jgi:hypothetical protein
VRAEGDWFSRFAGAFAFCDGLASDGADLFVWVFVYKPNTQTNMLLPARS